MPQEEHEAERRSREGFGLCFRHRKAEAISQVYSKAWAKQHVGRLMLIWPEHQQRVSETKSWTCRYGHLCSPLLPFHQRYRSGVIDMRLSILLPLLQSALLVAGEATPEAATVAAALPEDFSELEELVTPEFLPETAPEAATLRTREEDLDELLAELLAQRLAKRVAEPIIQPNTSNPGGSSTNATVPTNSTNTTTPAVPPNTNVTIPTNGTNTTAPGNVTLPVNGTAPLNVTLPTNGTNTTAPGNVTLPINGTYPGNITLPINGTAPTNVTLPINGTAPSNVTLPINGTNTTTPALPPNTNATLPINGTNTTTPSIPPATNVTLPTNGTIPLPPTTNVTLPTNGTNTTTPSLPPATNVTLPINGTTPTNCTTPSNNTCPGSCPANLRAFLSPFSNLKLAQQMCAKVESGTYKYNKSYALMASWIGKDVKRFCCCIAKPAAKVVAKPITKAVAPRSIEDATPAADLEDVFEKRDASQIADIVQEAHRMSEKTANGVLESLQNADDQSFFGPPRLQGYGGAILRKRRTTVKTMVEVTTEE